MCVCVCVRVRVCACACMCDFSAAEIYEGCLMYSVCKPNDVALWWPILISVNMLTVTTVLGM